jgi:carbohydrate-selective porin OprB
MPTVIKMRCNRITEYDAGGESTLREFQLTTTDQNGAPLNDSAEVVSASFVGNISDLVGAEIEHNALLDVTINTAAAKKAAPKKG